MNKLFFLILIYPSIYFSQVNDASFWIENEIEKKINPKISFSLTDNLRFIENYSRLQTHFNELSFNYNINEHFSCEFKYRHTHRFQLENYISFRNRFTFDLREKFKLNSFDIQLRQRFQQQYNDALSTNWTNSKLYFRQKLELTYSKFGKWEPSAFGELFLEQFVDLNNVRYGFGLSYQFNKHMKTNISYFIDQELNVSNPYRYFVLLPSFKYIF